MSVSANQLMPMQEGCRGNEPVAASTYIYKGTLTFIALASGNLDDDTGSGANSFAGMALDEVDNSGGSGGAKRCDVQREGVFPLPGSGFSQASVGQAVFATDNYTVTTDGTTAGAVRIGVCVGYISSTKINVMLHVDGPKFVDISIPITPHASLTARNLFVAHEPLRITHMDYVPDLAQGGTLTATLVKATSTATPASGTTPLCAAASINCNGTAHTVQSITPSSTVADLLLAPGDRIGIVFSAALTTGAGVVTIRARKN